MDDRKDPYHKQNLLTCRIELELIVEIVSVVFPSIVMISTS